MLRNGVSGPQWVGAVFGWTASGNLPTSALPKAGRVPGLFFPCQSAARFPARQDHCVAQNILGTSTQSCRNVFGPSPGPASIRGHFVVLGPADVIISPDQYFLVDLINRPARRHPPQLKPSVLPSRCSGMPWVWNYTYRRYYFEPEDLGAWTCDGCRFGGDKAQQHMDRATHGKAKRRRSILVLWRLPGDRYTPNRP